MGIHERPVVAGFDHGAVELVVEFKRLALVTTGGRSDLAPVQFANRIEFVVGGSFACESDAQCLERGEHREGIHGLVEGRRGDDCASVAQEEQETFGREHLVRLAQRRARNAEALAQDALLQAHPRFPDAANDLIAQPVEHFGL